jgi:acyl dehydratase
VETLDRSSIGKRFPGVRVSVDAAEISAFARAIGEINPMYFDESAALAKGYRSIPAPPTFVFCLKIKHQTESPDLLLWSMLGTVGKGITLLHAEQSFVYESAICAGDTLTFDERIADIYEKKAGALVFVVLETSVVNQQGERVARIRHTEVARRDGVSALENR